MQLNNQNSQPRAADYHFQGYRTPYGERGYGRGNIPGDVHQESPNRYQRGGGNGFRGGNHSAISTESAFQRNTVEGQDNKDASVISEACSTNKLSNVLARDENELLLKLQTPSFGFVQRLQQGSNSPLMTQLVIKVIAKSCKSVHQAQLIDLLSKIQNSTFLKCGILQYLNEFVAEDKKVEAEICSSIITILRTLVRLFPSKSLAIITFLCAPLQRVLTIDTSDYDLAKTEYKKLLEETTAIRKELQSGIVQRDQEREEEWTVDEREDYRRMSVNPTSEDIRGQGDPYLRKNKIYQPYKDAHDYLDVQFRLMKEDLVRPLREGLAELLRSREEKYSMRTKSNMKVYNRVQITSVRCSQHGLIYKIQFDVSRLGRVQWEAGKRLMLGSLVCLSTDEFKTMLIATIAERDVKDLRRGVTYLYFDREGNGNEDTSMYQTYEMIESPAYYEPYKCVLQALQRFTEKETLPFEKYLLNKSGEESVSPPNYLRKDTRYDFSSLMQRARSTKSSIVSRRKLSESDSANLSHRSGGIVTVLDLRTWPTAEELGLDASQYNALRTAITKEFAVIQGPPGTGKTFIGVKLVQLMLENKTDRRTLGSGPIMLVCFTNHALDQFLEEIIRLYPNYVDAGLFVRVGGTCKSENEELKKCFLKYIKQNRTSAACQEFRGETIKPRDKMAELETEIMKLSAYAEIALKELIHPAVLRPYMKHVQFKRVEHFLQWLCDGEAEPGTPNLLDIASNAFGVPNQNDLQSQSDLEDPCEDIELSEAEEREQNENNLMLANEKFQYMAQSVLDENKFIKLHGHEDKRSRESYLAVKSIHLRFHEVFKESDDTIAVKNQWKLTLADRWRLYNYWVTSFMAAHRSEMQTLLKEHATEKRKLEEVQDEVDHRIFSHAKIIAMTTSVAAKRSHLLKRLAPKIVIVEEAAEVLEAHVVASLSDKCEHLILIGDHQQLKPKPADYNLAKRCRLDISLFEKVVLNKLHCDRLTIQHRMRPEIAGLLVPHIYKSLENHESVLRYENVANVFGNLFFVNHSESENSTDDNRSHSNDHEATFISELCRYFLNVGYEPKQITVLTTYTGQFFLLRKLMPKSEFEGVRITPVDNFQGEENDIILLSLVRSNDESEIGFLSVSNRVCVALSRARKGLYIIGNANLLLDESPIWRDILDTLKKQNKLVDSLPLGCHKHEIVNYVKVSADFLIVPRSGCDHPCDYRLPCGHACGKLCHELDSEHKHYKCRKPCQNLCARGIHRCRDLCFEKCSECKEMVEITLTMCGHQSTMCCYTRMLEDTFKCRQPCNLKCAAGHPCQRLCYEKCQCQVSVTKTLTRCQHKATMPCYLPELWYECTEPCRKVCPNGHACKKLCFQTCDPCGILVIKRLSACNHEAPMRCHLSERFYRCKEPCTKSCSSNHPCAKLCYEKCGVCEVPVTKILPVCEHETIVPCHMEVSTYLRKNNCLESCKKSCSYGHPCKKQCHEPCGDCGVMVKKVIPRCEHKAMMPCHQRVDSYICQIKCNRVFPCGHSCPDLCHVKCDDCQVSVEKVLPSCGHKAIMPCHREPRKHRCELSCERKCPEGHLCPKICGADCGICISKREMIFPKCNHVNMIECYLSPNQVICKSSCEKFLLCGHKCQEICGAMRCSITCKVTVEKELPCKHIARTYCHLDLNLFECHQEVEKTLPCGHVALVECHQDPKTFVCQEQVEKKLPCGHVATMACPMDPTTYPCIQKIKIEVCKYGHTEEVKCLGVGMLEDGENAVQCRTPVTEYRHGCPNICDYKMDCGHLCTRQCRECVANKRHEKCKQIFNKSFALCPHKSLCVSPLSPCCDFSSYTCFHRKNTSYRCKEPIEICLRRCGWSCPHITCTSACSQPCNRPPCNYPCRKPLKCGHVCSGLCGELCLSACLKCNKTSFTERTWPTADCITTKESRFLELQPCLHFVEVVSMDVWVQENVQQLPGNLDSSCFLRCPLCSEKVDFCPRYNQYIRRHELSLNAANELIKASENLKRTIDKYFTLLPRTKQCTIKIKENLRRLGVTDRIKLGTLSILHEIEVVEVQNKNSNSMEKFYARMLDIRQRISEEEKEEEEEDKTRLAGDVLMIYQLYMKVQVRRLMTFVRGPNLKVLDECSRILDELDGIEVTEDNFQSIWIKIEKLNRKLSTKLSPIERKDQITDYVDHLNRFYDLHLDATFHTHWACCRLGHVYSTKEKVDKDQIDESCPQCHPLHNVIFYFLKYDLDENAVITTFDTSAYYKSNEITVDPSHLKWEACSESDMVAEFSPGVDAGISGMEKNLEVTHSDLKAGTASRSVSSTPERTVIGETLFQGGFGGFRGRSGRGGKTSWTRPDRAPELWQTRNQPRSSDAAQPSTESPRHAFKENDRLHGDSASSDNWRIKDGGHSGKARASAFGESSCMRRGASVANVQPSRSLGSWRVSNDEKDQDNWRAPADRINVQQSTTREFCYANPPRRGGARLERK